MLFAFFTYKGVCDKIFEIKKFTTDIRSYV